MSKALIFHDTAALTAAQKVALVMPFTAEILGATLQLNTAPTGSAATFDIEVAGVSILAASLSVAASAFVPTTAASFRKNGTITGAVAGTSGTAVYTVATGHLFKVGDVVTVASVAVSAGSAVPYNFTDKQVSAVTATTVTVTGIVGTPGTYSSGGTIVCTTSPVIVPKDAVLSFDCDQIGSTVAGSGYTLAIRYTEAADTTKAVGGLDASRF